MWAVLGLTLYLGWGAQLRDVSGALDVMTGRCLLGVLPGEMYIALLHV